MIYRGKPGGGYGLKTGVLHASSILRKKAYMMSSKKRLPVILLVISLVLVLAGSGFAQLFNTGMHKTDVSRIYFDTDKGTLSGLLYLPKGASESDPRPAVVVTHGYLNSAEMQDANAIELSRRGYAVLALDMYDHGHSKGNAENTGQFFSFWPSALYDAASYMYEQPYVLKDEQGNGIIGVTGHSMGGFSSSMAIYMDEQAYGQTGVRKIYCGLSEGSDFMWTSYLGLTPEVAAQNGGGRFMGKVCAQYDEFFFNADGAGSDTVVHKNYVGTASGKAFLEQEAPEAGVWYDTADGGRRIVYQPAETHPWNHFSKTTTGHAIDFYNTAFAAYNQALAPADGADQVWQWKEFFELVALIGLVLMVVPIVLLVLELPFFKKARTEALAPQPSVSTPVGKVGTLLMMLFCVLLPAILFPALMDKDLTGEPLMYLCDAGAILLVTGAAALVLGLRGKVKYLKVGGVLTALFGCALVIFTSVPTYDTAFWPAPSVNQIAYWTLISAVLSGLILSVVYMLMKGPQGATLKTYGLKAGPVSIAASLCTALVAVAAVYALVFVIDAIFKTDFRIWVFAFKTFEPSVIPAMLKYLPTFFLYYLISTVAICVNTNTQRLQGFKGYLAAMALNAGGIAVFLARQYITLFATGTAAHPSQALSSILLVAMVPTLAIAACFSRALYKRTGNVWTPAFLNAILMTMMTLANTCVYYQG